MNREWLIVPDVPIGSEEKEYHVDISWLTFILKLAEHGSMTVLAVLTGKGPDCRSHIIHELMEFNVNVVEKCDRHVNFLVCSDLDTTTKKMTMAIEHKISIITYDQLYKAMEVLRVSNEQS